MVLFFEHAVTADYPSWQKSALRMHAYSQACAKQMLSMAVPLLMRSPSSHFCFNFVIQRKLEKSFAFATPFLFAFCTLFTFCPSRDSMPAIFRDSGLSYSFPDDNHFFRIEIYLLSVLFCQRLPMLSPFANQMMAHNSLTQTVILRNISNTFFF